MKVTVLAGGVGGARFLLGVREYVSSVSTAESDIETVPASEPSSASIPARKPARIPTSDDVADANETSTRVPESRASQPTAIVNVGDDTWMHDLRLCPDLDSCMYTLGGGIDEHRGWGRQDETWSLKAELAAYGAKPDWFGLGDRDTATHLIRSQMLRAGYRLSDITEALSKRWSPGVRLLPVTDDRSETYVVVTHPTDGDKQAIHFQEWWVRYRAQIETHDFVHIGADEAAPAPGVLDSIRDADIVLIAPSNPIVSIAPILAIPGVRGALRTTNAPVVGISPIIGNAPLRGMADVCLRVAGSEVSSQGVAEYYGARESTGILDGWLSHPGDTVSVPGIAALETPIMMTNPSITAEMVASACKLVGVQP
ncbi:2-phospho-L-lactate transferase [Hoyosella rhizosphaerae]|uniref:2-phospho-L-lactate transferase n=1 Tax=Hoyosella rhizosphaerae TaxID=1755582 RepID=A0A916UBL7_9ACTN|nr:2-phospho-L-lactate transferase [Hoyosella rhizosphaerae]MBN4926009.1 2-phospho-L-lactate transferase [Hoyosella rhizosphaerae]GGC66273.1 2-phospho-L-lactate transferase [Hoyosella rhizosphaerae]